MKQLKDYLSYYLGCDIMITHDFNTGNGREKIYKNEIRSLTPQRLLYALDWDMQAHPILRRLEDITDEEATKLDIMHQACLLNSNEYKVSDLVFSVEQFHYLLKQGFDLFNLIDENLAIDKKTLNG